MWRRYSRAVPTLLDQRLPTNRLVIIDAGYFVWEEEPAKYAAAVLDSITGNWPWPGARQPAGTIMNPSEAGRTGS